MSTTGGTVVDIFQIHVTKLYNLSHVRRHVDHRAGPEYAPKISFGYMYLGFGYEMFMV